MGDAINISLSMGEFEDRPQNDILSIKGVFCEMFSAFPTAPLVLYLSTLFASYKFDHSIVWIDCVI